MKREEKRGRSRSQQYQQTILIINNNKHQQQKEKETMREGGDWLDTNPRCSFFHLLFHCQRGEKKINP